MVDDKLPGIDDSSRFSYQAANATTVAIGSKGLVRRLLAYIGVTWGGQTDPYRHPGGAGFVPPQTLKSDSVRRNIAGHVPQAVNPGMLSSTDARSDFVQPLGIDVTIEPPPPARVFTLETSPVEPPAPRSKRLEVDKNALPPTPPPSRDIRRQP